MHMKIYAHLWILKKHCDTSTGECHKHKKILGIYFINMLLAFPLFCNCKEVQDKSSYQDRKEKPSKSLLPSSCTLPEDDHIFMMNRSVWHCLN
mmetsp:Transcript_12819/g.16840  ORF Transcript_12819/g.16840 Transcript_12819/m.16840 type:complete len:93 (+) Transcript_12819:893-1171(+)